jgi:hypothetical protein
MKILRFILISIVCMIIIFPMGVVLADTTTSGGTQDGVRVREVWRILQNKYVNAHDLHFTIWEKPDNVEINGWEIEISDFHSSFSYGFNQPDPASEPVNLPELPPTSDPDNGNHAINVIANGGAVIPQGSWVTIDANLWLTDWNTKRIYGAIWTNDEPVSTESLPDHGWEIDWPKPKAGYPGTYIHELTIYNDDNLSTLNVTGLTFKPDMTWHNDLTTISFPAPEPDFSLAPGTSQTFNIETTGSMAGGHVYFYYGIEDGVGLMSEDWVDHPITADPSTPPPSAVGGIILPVNKPGMLLPTLLPLFVILVVGASLATLNFRLKTRAIS